MIQRKRERHHQILGKEKEKHVEVAKRRFSSPVDGHIDLRREWTVKITQRGVDLSQDHNEWQVLSESQGRERRLGCRMEGHRSSEAVTNKGARRNHPGRLFRMGKKRVK